jgi:hypothetical protein
MELYGDALSLLEKLAGRIQTGDRADGDNTGRTSIERRPRWRVCLTGDYVRPEDVDTAGLSPEERDSVARMLEETRDEPLDAYLSASVEITPALRAIETIEPSLHLGNRRLRGGVAVDLAQAPLRAELELNGEKRLWLRPSDSSSAIAGIDSATPASSKTFTLSEPHPLDGVDGRARIELASSLTDRQGLRLPLEVRSTVYRHNRGSYRSCVDYRVAPALEGGSADLRKQLAAETALEYHDCFDPGNPGHYNPAADSVDAFRFRPSLIADLWLERVSVSLETAYEYLSYPNRRGLESMHELGGRGRVATTLTETFGTRLTVEGTYLRENRGGSTWLIATSLDTIYCGSGGCDVEVKADTQAVDVGGYWLEGGEVSLAPAVEMTLGDVAVTMTTPWIVKRFVRLDSLAEGRLTAPVYIDETSEGFEPEIRLRYDHEVVHGQAWVAWLVEDVARQWEAEEHDSRGLGTGFELYVRPLEWLSVEGRFGYRLRKEIAGGKTENLSLSMGCCTRF